MRLLALLLLVLSPGCVTAKLVETMNHASREPAPVMASYHETVELERASVRIEPSGRLALTLRATSVDGRLHDTVIREDGVTPCERAYDTPFPRSDVALVVTSSIAELGPGALVRKVAADGTIASEATPLDPRATRTLVLALAPPDGSSRDHPWNVALYWPLGARLGAEPAGVVTEADRVLEAQVRGPELHYSQPSTEPAGGGDSARKLLCVLALPFTLAIDATLIGGLGAVWVLAHSR
jgi:hypothetical protein